MDPPLPMGLSSLEYQTAATGIKKELAGNENGKK
jgi:hypothetical protein